MEEDAAPGLPDLLLEIQEAPASVYDPGQSKPSVGTVSLKLMLRISALVLFWPGFSFGVVVT